MHTTPTLIAPALRIKRREEPSVGAPILPSVCHPHQTREELRFALTYSAIKILSEVGSIPPAVERCSTDVSPPTGSTDRLTARNGSQELISLQYIALSHNISKWTKRTLIHARAFPVSPVSLSSELRGERANREPTPSPLNIDTLRLPYETHKTRRGRL